MILDAKGLHQDARLQYLMTLDAKGWHQESRMQYFPSYHHLCFHCFCRKHIILSTKINFDTWNGILSTHDNDYLYSKALWTSILISYWCLFLYFHLFDEFLFFILPSSRRVAAVVVASPFLCRVASPPSSSRRRRRRCRCVASPLYSFIKKNITNNEKRI